MNTLISRFTIPEDRFSGAVLVTGASGCIGAWVVASLTASGVEVIASDLSVDRRRASLVMGADAASCVVLRHVATKISLHCVEITTECGEVDAEMGGSEGPGAAEPGDATDWCT